MACKNDVVFVDDDYPIKSKLLETSYELSDLSIPVLHAIFRVRSKFVRCDLFYNLLIQNRNPLTKNS